MADRFRVERPDMFETLRRVKATFLKQREGVNMVYRCPHFRVREGYVEGEGEGYIEGEGDAIVDVRWAPPFEGPLDISDMDECEVEEYYQAYRKFEEMVDPIRHASEHTSENVKEFRLREGECLVFNNRRLLHGRRGFQGVGERHLRGTYCSIDEGLNVWRVMQREQGIFYKGRAYGNGSYD